MQNSNQSVISWWGGVGRVGVGFSPPNNWAMRPQFRPSFFFFGARSRKHLDANSAVAPPAASLDCSNNQQSRNHVRRPTSLPATLRRSSLVRSLHQRRHHPAADAARRKVPWRMSAPQKYRHRKRLQRIDRLVDCVDNALKKQGMTVAAVEQWKAEMPTEAEMEPRDKYTIFSRNAKNYRKGGHSKSAAQRAGRGANEGAQQRYRSGPGFRSVSILPVSREGRGCTMHITFFELLFNRPSHIFRVRCCASFGHSEKKSTISHIAAENLVQIPASLQTPASTPYPVPTSFKHARKRSKPNTQIYQTSHYESSNAPPPNLSPHYLVEILVTSLSASSQAS
jgi:hypothetical protein